MIEPLCSAVKDVEQLLLDRDLSDLDRADGQTYIVGLLRAGLDRAMLSSDPNFPRFYYTKDTVSRWGTGNPDNVIRSADIDGEAQYLITGERGTTAEIVFETLSVVIGDHATDWGKGIGSLDTSTLKVDSDGSYRIIVGGDPPDDGGNYLPSGPIASAVFVRHVFGADDERAGSIAIRRISPPTAAARSTGDLLELAARRIVANAVFHENLAVEWRKTLPVNSAQPILSTPRPGHLPGQHNAKGRFELEPDQALIVSMGHVDCRYAGMSISHDLWSYVLDYEMHLNQARAHRSSDGRYHYVICAQDPMVPNWYPTLSHPSGMIFFRWTGVRGDPPEAPEFRVVPISAVRDQLPSDEPVITPEERRAARAARREILDRRFYGRS